MISEFMLKIIGWLKLTSKQAYLNSNILIKIWKFLKMQRVSE